jgi:hypothetical protein
MPKDIAPVSPIKRVSDRGSRIPKGLSPLVAYIQGTGLSSHIKINQYLRNELILKGSAKEAMERNIDQIRQSMKRHEGGLLVYRGMKIPPPRISTWKRDCEKLRQRNGTFTLFDKGFVSTSKSPISSHRFMGIANSVMMIILIDGRELIDFEKENVYVYTQHKIEREVLLHDGTTISFVGVVTKADCDNCRNMPFKVERYTAVNRFEEFVRKPPSGNIISVAKDLIGGKFSLILKNETNYILFATIGP